MRRPGQVTEPKGTEDAGTPHHNEEENRMSAPEVQRDAVQLAKIVGKMKRVQTYGEYRQLDICREAVEVVLGMYQQEDWR